MKPEPLELLNHLTLPVILDIQTNPPNDSVERTSGHKPMRVPLSQQVNAVSRTRFRRWGAIRKHTTKKRPLDRTRCTISERNLQGKAKTHFSCGACKSKCLGRWKSQPGTD